MKGNKGASSCSGERHSNSRQTEEQVQTGTGPGIYKEQLKRPIGRRRVNKAERVGVREET